ncbi:hypothetical protein ACFL1X_13415 [Candidatus Hydrogenedentota bacterium]
MFAFTLLEIGNWVGADQSTFRLVHVPNNRVVREQVYNYTYGFEFIWNEINVTVTFESDWHEARDIMNGLAKELTVKAQEDAKQAIGTLNQKYSIYPGKLTPITYTTIAFAERRLDHDMYLGESRRACVDEYRAFFRAFHTRPVDFEAYDDFFSGIQVAGSGMQFHRNEIFLRYPEEWFDTIIIYLETAVEFMSRDDNLQRHHSEGAGTFIMERNCFHNVSSSRHSFEDEEVNVARHAYPAGNHFTVCRHRRCPLRSVGVIVFRNHIERGLRRRSRFSRSSHFTLAFTFSAVWK